MAETNKKRTAAPVLASMTKPGFNKMLLELNDEHGAADEAAMSVASAYKKLKKQGINLEAIRLVRRLKGLDNPSKIQAFLADFDRLRELAGFDDQQQLFEEDKTAPQKQAESAKVVEIKTGKAPAEPEVIPEPEQKPKAAKKPKAEKAAKPVSKAALFATGDDEADVTEISDEEKARQAGIVSGAAGEDYDNPHDGTLGPLHDAWHAGWVQGTEQAAEDAQKASA